MQDIIVGTIGVIILAVIVAMGIAAAILDQKPVEERIRSARKCGYSAGESGLRYLSISAESFKTEDEREAYRKGIEDGRKEFIYLFPTKTSPPDFVYARSFPKRWPADEAADEESQCDAKP